MIVQTRLNSRTRSNIELYKTNFFEKTAKISLGYIIGMAADRIPEILSNEILLNRAVEAAAKRDQDTPSPPTSITLRQEVYNSIEAFRENLELRFGPMHFSKILDILMIAVNVENTRRDTETSEITKYIDQLRVDDIDSLVFRDHYTISIEPHKTNLYEIVRQYLEKHLSGIELCNSLRNKISSAIRSYSDYYNPGKYSPPRRKTLGTAYISYIGKAVAGYFLVVSEIDGLDIDDIIAHFEELCRDID